MRHGTTRSKAGRGPEKREKGVSARTVESALDALRADGTMM